jgi:ABC-2 type transport system ATP-binding protein
MTDLLIAKNLHKSFGGKPVIRNINFAVKKGQVAALLGPNGAGKTTTMRLLTGYLKPDRGEITIAGKNFAEDPTLAKKNFGYLPEGAPLYGEMTVKAQLQFIAAIRDVKTLKQTIIECGLTDVLYEPVETLSKGYRRRVALAIALMHAPPILILDEPTDGLDPNQKREFHKMIHSIKANRAILISTHQLEEVSSLCDRTIIINKGAIVFDAPMAEIDKKGGLGKCFYDHTGAAHVA